jgi:hypothetical protein
MVRPALPRAFPGSIDADFGLSEKRTEVHSKRKLSTETVQHDGTTYHPQLESLSITIVGDELHISSDTSVELSPGIIGHMKATHFVRLKLVNKPDGTETITYEQARDPIVTEPTVTYSEGIEIIKIILEIFAVIVTAILTVLTAGAFLLVALVIVGLVVGLAIAAPQIVGLVLKKDIRNDIPSIDLLVLNSTAPIRWTGASQFRLTSLSLNGCLQMGGDPGFA